MGLIDIWTITLDNASRHCESVLVWDGTKIIETNWPGSWFLFGPMTCRVDSFLDFLNGDWGLWGVDSSWDQTICGADYAIGQKNGELILLMTNWMWVDTFWDKMICRIDFLHDKLNWGGRPILPVIKWLVVLILPMPTCIDTSKFWQPRLCFWEWCRVMMTNINGEIS